MLRRVFNKYSPLPLKAYSARDFLDGKFNHYIANFGAFANDVITNDIPELILETERRNLHDVEHSVPRAVGENKSDIRERIEYFKGIGMNEDGVHQLLIKYPTLINVRLREPISKKIKYLSHLGFSNEGILEFFDQVLRFYPQFLELSLEADVKPVFEYLHKEGLSQDGVLIMALKCPNFIGQNTGSTLKPKIEFLKNLNITLGNHLECILITHPKILTMSLESCLLPCVKYLKEKVEFETEEITQLILNYPAILTLPLDVIDEKVSFLFSQELNTDNIKIMILAHPSLIEPPLEDSMKPVIQCLTNILQQHAMRYVIKEHPQCLSLDYLSDFWPKIRFFIDLGFEPKHFKTLLTQYPSLLTCSLDEQIVPAFKHALYCTGLSLNQLYISFSTFPELLRSQIERKFDIDSMVPPKNKLSYFEQKQRKEEGYISDDNF